MSIIDLSVRAEQIAELLEGKSSRRNSRLTAMAEITGLLKENGMDWELIIFEDMARLVREVYVEGFHVRVQAEVRRDSGNRAELRRSRREFRRNRETGQ